MQNQTIKPNVFAVGALDAERRLFDELIPLPDGTSYNSYLVKGSEKVALIDTVDPPKFSDLLANIEKTGVKKIDYIVANHAEQDHSGSIPFVLEKYPQALVVTNEKCKGFLMDLLGIPEDKFKVIKDGETLSLGDKTLRFILFPWVHWPETMLTYLPEDKILFSCDLFGSHLALDALFVENEERAYTAAKRYYAEIMMPFRTIINNNINKVLDLDIDIIAASHGPLYDRPGFILAAYRDWLSDQVKNEVLIPYVSMHGSVQAMVDRLAKSLQAKDIPVRAFPMSETDIGEFAMALVDAATVVIASPTVLTGPHPLMVSATYLFNALRPKTKFAAIIGSYGWAGKMIEHLSGMLIMVKPEILGTILSKGHPTADDLEALDELAEQIFQKHKEIGAD